MPRYAVLLALQINNWNEARKDANWEIYYLNRLKEDIQKDTSEIQGTLTHSYERIMIGNQILSQLDGDFLQEIIELSNANRQELIFAAQNKFPARQSSNFGLLVSRMTVSRNFDMRTKTYNEILATGRLELIGNAQLREDISDYYGRISSYHRENQKLADLKYNQEKVLQFEEIQANFVDNHLRPLLNQSVDRTAIRSTQKAGDITTMHYPTPFDNMNMELLVNQEFANQLVDLIFFTNRLINTYGRIEIDLNQIDSIAYAIHPAIRAKPYIPY